MGAITRSELVTHQAVWLLEIAFAGQLFRFASRTVNIESDNGSIRFDGAFDAPEYEEEFDLFSISPQLQSFDFELIFPIDVALHVNRGHQLDGAPGTLSIWIEGRTYEERFKVIAGQVREPEYGEDQEPVSFSLEQNTFEDRSIFPDLNAIISAVTWPNLPGENDGKIYPFVFGRPGPYMNSLGEDLAVPGSPAYIVDETNVASASLNAVPLLISGYPCTDGSVTVRDLTNGSTSGRIIFHGPDSLGRTCAQVMIDGASSSGTLKAYVDHEYWITWDGSAGGGVNRTRTGPITTAGELLYRLLQEVTTPVDLGRVAAATSLLSSFKVAGYIDDPNTVWDWLQDNLFPLIPTSIVAGASGIYPLVWNVEATNRDVRGDLLEGRDMWRTSRIRYERGKDLLNEIKLNYALNASTGNYRTHSILTGDTPNDDFRFRRANLYSRLSRQRYGALSEERSSDILYERESVSVILNWWSRFFGFPFRAVDYRLHNRWAWLELGTAVSLTDPKVSLTDQVALLKGTRRKNDELIATFLLLEDPARDKRA